jgi:hypothetical protein
MFMGKKLGNGFSFTHQLVGGVSDHDLGNAGASVVVGAHEPSKITTKPLN